MSFHALSLSSSNLSPTTFGSRLSPPSFRQAHLHRVLFLLLPSPFLPNSLLARVSSPKTLLSSLQSLAMAARDRAHQWQLGHPWPRSRWFREAARQQLAPGELPHYRKPTPSVLVLLDNTDLQAGERMMNGRAGFAHDRTAFHPGQQWTRDDLPEIIYMLRPPQEWFEFGRTALPAQKLDANGQPMVEAEPEPGQPARPLLDYEILPDRVSNHKRW